ncbi:beta strand repeat-containing protein [Bradyrhizobium neotropicale]|uniref:Uncharacterized protein n=1 Tax=Bradyrhizobium neotropicale TaxID=1497615 RepID=A0A176ZCD3_9BRAD|nr:choice-of-anchor tandem repeat GloVer-containing protein [Bradyrhizobium neotropicale]OAF17572.1 hypothetical protein AXW67_08710 [Bradyrhizobium neotropicale]
MFNGTNGSAPEFGNLIFDSNGNLFGTTLRGGAYGYGTVFEIPKTANGYASAPTVLVSFTSSNGAYPSGSLLADANGNLFGTTVSGGAAGQGTVFEIAKTDSGYANAPTTLVSFTSANASPNGGLIADANGNLFGTTSSGGPNNAGTVFEIAKTANGYASAPTTLINFNYSNGGNPSGSLIADANGNLFGTTSSGGASASGTVFEIAKTANGYASTPTTLVSFNGRSNGAQPRGSLIMDANGNLFGTTNRGGANQYGTVFEIAKSANGYASAPTTLASFDSQGGVYPYGGLIMDANGNLYGTTSDGGGSFDGAIFEIAKTANGYSSNVTTLLSFRTNNSAYPTGGLIADANGNLYGTTMGISGANGTVFEISGTGFVPVPPTLAITGISPDTGASTTDGLTNVSTVAVNGTIDVADAGQTISVYDGATLVGTTMASADGHWSLAGVTLTQGANPLTAQATSSQGTGTSPIFTATLDTTPPVVSVGASPIAGTEHLGQTITLVLSFSEAMKVSGGTPTLTLNDGGIARYDATATAALGDPTKLAFTYTVSASDTPVDAVAVVDHNLNGASITDLAGNAPDYSGLSASIPGLSVRPTAVTSVLASPSSGTESIGQTITLTLVFNQGVTVSGGTPTFTLNNGGTAVYDAAATAALGDPTKMVLSYTVAASDSPTNALAIVRGDQNGAVIVDATGHGPDFTAAFTSFPGIQIQSGASVVSVVASPTDGVEHVGDVLTFTISMNRAVSVSGGTPTLQLSNNGTAVYDAAATAALGDPTKLVFSYTVAASDGSVSSMNPLYVAFGSQNGAAILDSTGSASDFSATGTGFPGIQIDAAAQVTVKSVVASPSSGIEQAGDTIVFTMTMSGAVTVSGGTPTFTLNNGGKAIYDAAATAALNDPTRLVFKYTVGASDFSANDLTFVRGDQNGAIIVDAAWHGPDFSAAFTNFPGLAIVTPATAVTSVIASPATQILFSGSTVTFTLTMNRPVTITGGTPTLALNDGGTATYDATATAALGDPTKLVFKYTVSASDLTTTSLGIVREVANGAAIVDQSGAAADFSGAITNFPNIGVLTAATTVTSVTGSPSGVTEQPGDVITITFTMSRAVTVTGGTPTLTLNDGGTATYDAAATAALGDPTKLVFSYAVRADYNVHNVDSLAVVQKNNNGAVISDGSARGEPDFTAMTTPIANLAVKVGIDLANIAFGPSTTLGYAANPDNSGGVLTVSDGTHSSAITLLGQYAAADFHAWSDFHGGTLVTDPGLTGAAAATFLSSPHT